MTPGDLIELDFRSVCATCLHHDAFGWCKVREEFTPDDFVCSDFILDHRKIITRNADEPVDT